MKALITGLLLFLTLSAIAQKQRLEGDDSPYLCKNDSVNDQALQSLRNQQVDTTIEILYDYDNGRIENTKRIVIWKKNNVGYVRIIIGCSRIYKDQTFTVDLDQLFSYIVSTKFDDINVRIKIDNGSSHDTGYFININLPFKKVDFHIRDNALRGSEPTSDTRIKLAKMLIQVIEWALQSI